jgi:hypothetical protein
MVYIKGRKLHLYVFFHLDTRIMHFFATQIASAVGGHAAPGADAFKWRDFPAPKK